MIDIGKWDWIVNKNDMTCRNIENDVTIKMEKSGGHLRGILHDMPTELFAKISEQSNGEKIIEKIVKMAEDKYKKHR